MDAAYHAQVDARIGQVVEVMSQDARSTWDGHALVANGKDDERLSRILEEGLGHPTPGPAPRISSGTFEIITAITILLRAEDRLAPGAVEHVRHVITEGILHRDNTENHWLMHYTTLLLAAERWPETQRWGNGLTTAAVHAEARRWILGMIERTARFGHHEYDSPIYHILHMACMTALADHAHELHVRQQAQNVLALFVADLALENFHGTWAGGHSREGDRQNTWTYPGSIAGLQYIYFGGDFDPLVHCDGRLGPVLSSAYRPPRVFAEMANDRTRAHVVRKTKAPRAILRHSQREAAPVRKYTYMSPSFALGSTQVGLPGPPAGPIDLVSWDLTWQGPRHQAKIVSNHPFRSSGRMSAFLSETPQTVGTLVGRAKPHLMTDDRFCGGSPYEQMLQHEGTVILLYRIPETDDCRFVNLYLPQSINWVQRAGWILGSTGDFHIAVRPFGSCIWDALHDQQVDGWMVRLKGPDTGLVLETVEALQMGFAAFCDARVAAAVDLSGWPQDNRVAVATTSGDSLQMEYGNGPDRQPGVHLVNGERVDYESYALYDAPGVAAPVNTGRMHFISGDASLTLDFGIDPASTPIPMRVIG
jgi:hypothetical protein